MHKWFNNVKAPMIIEDAYVLHNCLLKTWKSFEFESWLCQCGPKRWLIEYESLSWVYWLLTSSFGRFIMHISLLCAQKFNVFLLITSYFPVILINRRHMIPVYDFRVTRNKDSKYFTTTIKILNYTFVLCLLCNVPLDELILHNM